MKMKKSLLLISLLTIGSISVATIVPFFYLSLEAKHNLKSVNTNTPGLTD
jgi:hypothetical protein